MSALLYHYTNARGALGILESRSLWLSDYRFLNDRNELSRALVDFGNRFPFEVRKSLDWGFWWNEQTVHWCVLSLSESPRILSQWRAYSEDGRGFCLGINRSLFDRDGLRLLTCQYEDHDKYVDTLVDRHKDKVDLIYRKHQEFLAEPVGRRNKWLFRDWAVEHTELFEPIVFDLLVLKNPAFAEERELRVVRSLPTENARVRESSGLLIPYTTLKFPRDDEATKKEKLIVGEVWLGPRCNRLNARSLHAMNVGPCKIEQYDCGYV